MVILILSVCDKPRDEVFFYGFEEKNFCYFLSEINYLKPSRVVQKCSVTELKTGPCFLSSGKVDLLEIRSQTHDDLVENERDMSATLNIYSSILQHINVII